MPPAPASAAASVLHRDPVDRSAGAGLKDEKFHPHESSRLTADHPRVLLRRGQHWAPDEGSLARALLLRREVGHALVLVVADLERLGPRITDFDLARKEAGDTEGHHLLHPPTVERACDVERPFKIAQ